MPFIARRKLTDTSKDAIRIEDLDLNKDCGVDFYCPCDVCSCRLHIRTGRNGEGRAHFFKLPSDDHSKECWVPFDSRNEAGNLTAEGLILRDFIDNLRRPEIHEHPQGNTHRSPESEPDNPRPVPIRTIRQLYLYCSNHADTDILGETAEKEHQMTIRDIFVGRKTRYYYKNYFSGNKLVEAQYVETLINPRTNLKSLLLAYPFSAKEGENVLLFKVRFNNSALADRLVRRVEGETRPVLVCTYWNRSKENNDIYGYIDSGKQIRVFRG